MYRRKRARKGKKKLERLGDFLEKALKRKKISIDIMDHDIRDAWKKAIGPQISAQSEPFKFKNGMLYVRVSTPAWMQELQFMKQDLMDRVNAAMEKETVKNIHFSLGHTASSPSDSGTDDKTVPDDFTLKEREKRLIANATANITDGELKTTIERIMKKEIINRKLTGDG